jgi:hypothetical protein
MGYSFRAKSALGRDSVFWILAQKFYKKSKKLLFSLFLEISTTPVRHPFPLEKPLFFRPKSALNRAVFKNTN